MATASTSVAASSDHSRPRSPPKNSTRCALSDSSRFHDPLTSSHLERCVVEQQAQGQLEDFDPNAAMPQQKGSVYAPVAPPH